MIIACWNDGHYCPNEPSWMVLASGGMGVRYACPDHLGDTVSILGSSRLVVMVQRLSDPPARVKP